MSSTGGGSGGASVLQALSAAVDLDPRRVLLRHLRQLEAERQAELAIFDQMLERLPEELVRRIIYMADALQRLDEFCSVPWGPDQLSRRLTSVALTSRAHRDTAALTACCVALPVPPLLRSRRLDSCLAWLACRRLSDVSLASAGLAHRVAAALAGALAQHAPALRLSSPLLVLVADRAGQVFEAGMLAAFCKLQTLQLDQYAGAQLAMLPASTSSLAVHLPGRTHERQLPQHPPRPPYLLAAPEGPLRPLLSPPSHRLAQLTVKGCMSGAGGPAGTPVEVHAAELFAVAAAVRLEVHTLCLLVPPRQPRQRRRWLAALVARAQALLRWTGAAAGQQLRGCRRSSGAVGAGGELYQPLAVGESSAEVALESGACRQGLGGSSMILSSSGRQQERAQHQHSRELVAALLDCFESSGCTSATLTATCVQLAPVGLAEAAAEDAQCSGAAAAAADRAAFTAAGSASGDVGSSSKDAGIAVAVPTGACSKQPALPELRHAELRQLLVAQPWRRNVLTALVRDDLLAEVGEGGAALGADAALLRLVLCRRSAAHSVDSRPLLCDLPGLEARLRAPVRHALLTCLGLATLGWGLCYVLFVATAPAAWLARGMLMCAALLVAGVLRRRAREGRPVDVGRAVRTAGRRLRLTFF